MDGLKQVFSPVVFGFCTAGIVTPARWRPYPITPRRVVQVASAVGTNHVLNIAVDDLQLPGKGWRPNPGGSPTTIGKEHCTDEIGQ
jgi:hypothetical protein